MVCSQKGEVGKTTLAAAIYYSLQWSGIPTSYYDLDDQGGGPETKSVDGAKVQVIDTPGAIQPQMPKWIAAADVVLIPARASERDIYVLDQFTRRSASHDFLEKQKSRQMNFADGVCRIGG